MSRKEGCGKYNKKSEWKNEKMNKQTKTELTKTGTDIRKRN